MTHLATIDIQKEKDVYCVGIRFEKKIVTFKVKLLKEAFSKCQEIIEEQKLKPHVCSADCQNPYKDAK